MMGIIPVTVESKHELYRIHLKTGECFALDITAAQFGHSTVVIPWGEYYAKRVERAEFRRVGFAAARTDLLMVKLAKLDSGRNHPHLLAEQWLYPVIGCELSSWLEHEKKMTLPVILQLPEQAYLQTIAEFTTRLSKAILEKLQNAKEQGGVIKTAELEGTRQTFADRCKAWHEEDEEGAAASMNKVLRRV